MIQVYNTLTNTKEPFQPQHPGQVLMYVCGPTVYNYIHIGNARSVVAFDVVRRYLEYRGYTVKYVSNFTDVDDKIIKAAAAEHMSVPELTDKYIKAFYADIDALNVKRATINPRVQTNIDAIIAFVQTLIDKGFAYQSGGDVYFAARKFKHYGELSGQNLDELEEGASQRLSANERALKRDPLDFAVWKEAKPDEISWASPWGKGRPGWHIECSVMATKYLADTIDIHAGGQDLTFPHHENEIAQSEAKTGKPFAKYWLHNGFVTVGEADEKMSKSLGNFVMVHDLLKQVDPQVLRFFMASVQYRRPIQYSQANLAKAKSNLAKFKQTLLDANFALNQGAAAADQVDAVQQAAAEKLITQFKAALDDDFNVQNGLAVLYDFAKQINIYVHQPTATQPTIEWLVAQLSELLAIYGIDAAQLVKTQTQSGDAHLQAKIEAMVRQRDAARQAKDFATSDRLRDELQALGVILEDTAQGTRWRLADDK